MLLSWHRVVELIDGRPEHNGSTCQSRTQYRVLSKLGGGSGLVSQVSCLGNAIVMVGIKKEDFCIFVALSLLDYFFEIK